MICRSLPCFLLLAVPVAAQPTVIGFEDLPGSTVLEAQYAHLGVVALTPVITVDQGRALLPHGGKYVLEALAAEFTTPEPITLSFTSGQNTVSLFAGAVGFGQPLTGTLTAFDSSGVLVGQDGPKPVNPGRCDTAFAVTAAGHRISRIALAIAASSGPVEAAVDDLSFEGAPPPDPGTLLPLVEITSPVGGARLDASTIGISGTVKGQGLPAEITVIMRTAQPGSSHRPGWAANVGLGPSGLNGERSFSTTVSLPIGAVEVSATARNTLGLAGKAVTLVFNLPGPVWARYQAGGGDAQFGPLKWSVGGAGCAVAAFGNGVIGFDGQQTSTIGPPVLAKWRQWVEAAYAFRSTSDDFCPLGDARTTVLGHAIAQSFRGGRIFSSAKGVFFVPKVFATAIDGAGGEETVGFPLSDPQRSAAAKTYLFQRFERPGVAVAATLEIKGSPAFLSLSRQGGDLVSLTKAGRQLQANTAAVLERAGCSSTSGPCQPLQLQMPAYDLAEVNAFNGDASPLCFLGEIAWRPVVRDDLFVPAIGFVKESRTAYDDLATMHECNRELSIGLRSGINSSDWNIDMAPFDVFRKTLATSASQADLHLEFEYCLVHYYIVADQYDLPEAGDLLFSGGRWIADCPHPPPTTELHPVIAMVHQRLTGTSTTAYLWVNGFYQGQPLEVDLYPPPRPAPNAYLTVSKPRDQDVTVGMNVVYAMDPEYFSHVRVRFSGTPRSLDVRSTDGFVQHKPGRVYRGRATVGWMIEPGYSVGTVPAQEW